MTLCCDTSKKCINSNAQILTHYDNRILKIAFFYQKMLSFPVQYRLVIADLVKFYNLRLEQYCRIHKYYTSCLIYGTEL